MTSSRLDRLFVLLESGSSSVTRSAAAKQLGEVQKLHPHELNTLLSRTAVYLKSTNWDTRIAAAEAVHAIVNNVPKWDPKGLPSDNSTSTTQIVPNAGNDRLRFDQFDMQTVLHKSSHFLASAGKEFDIDDDSMSSTTSSDTKERLLKQRQMLNARLGLDVAAQIGIIDSNSLYTNDDLTMVTEKSAITTANSCGSTATSDEDVKRPIGDVIFTTNPVRSNDKGLSTREINRAKRKARQANTKQQKLRDDDHPMKSNSNSNDGEEDFDTTNSGMMTTKRTKWDEDDLKGDEGGGDWPLEWFCDQLTTDLFSSAWETRHGAATALREILSLHGNGTGRTTYYTKQENEYHHQCWLEDIAIRFLCVLALDRFGDFLSDSVVAPVRETCAQALCTVFKLMSQTQCESALNILMELMKDSEWSARHGGLLGIKYLLAVRDDLVELLLPNAFCHILNGLSDVVDDVGAVAASALIPVAGKLVDFVPEHIPTIVSKLWDLLSDQDELASACNSFMGLLAAILSQPFVHKVLPPQPLNDVVPRLWPFLSHSTSSVRKATLQTLATLTERRPILWDAQLLQDAMRHVYQRVLVESNGAVRCAAEKVWSQLIENSGLDELLYAACPFVSIWLYLCMHSSRIPLDANYLIKPTQKASNRKPVNEQNNSLGITQKLFIGGSETTPMQIRDSNVVPVRCMTTRMLGKLSTYIIQPATGLDYSQPGAKPVECYEKVLLAHLGSKSALQRMITALVCANWAQFYYVDHSVQCPQQLKDHLHACLNERLYFDEIATSFTRLTQETRDFLATLKYYRIPITIENEHVYTLEKIDDIITNHITNGVIGKAKLKSKIQETLEERRRSIQQSVQQTAHDQLQLSTATLAAISGAIVMFRALPEKLTPVIKPLMESLRRETDQNLQRLTAGYLARLLEQCQDRKPCPNDKIIVNLCTFLRSDPEFTPAIDKRQQSSDKQQQSNYFGILSLENQQRNAEKVSVRSKSMLSGGSGSTGSSGRGPGRPSTSDLAVLDEVLKEEDDIGQKLNRNQRRGATFALTEAATYFGPNLPKVLPKLWELLIGQLVETISDPNNCDPTDWYGKDDMAEQLIWSLQVLEVITASLHDSLYANLMALSLERLAVLLSHPYRGVRHLAARCLGVFAKLDTINVMELVVSRIVPKLGATNSDIDRQGAVEAISSIVDNLQFTIIPYVVLLVVPLLGRMSDQNTPVRLMSTHCFATLIQLMPLDGGVPEPVALQNHTTLNKLREKERAFLRQLLSPRSIPDYEVPVPIQAQLRHYQQAGVNWLAFLNKYKLHGILCDDMGLGKTLQSICILAGDHFVRDRKYRETKSVDCSPLPSLVICPPTLTGHWVYEVEKFLSHKYLKPLQYNGTPMEREKLRHKFKKHNLIVASYDIVRKDIGIFSNIKWNYVVLDEGHVIKNGKTRTSIAIKNLISNHRLILSGTPIQNNVLELWSLFDFLMPGFLGTEKQFMARFSRPILASRDPKAGPKEQEAGVLAMESLHRQVLPFLLRRVKEDVLDDLPPKITQDYYCDLSALQERLYEDFSKTHAHQTLQESLTSNSTTVSSIQGNTHVFQALRYLQNVCNHPKLVLQPNHPQYANIIKDLGHSKANLDDIEHAAKLPALKQLLQDCGIGNTSGTTGSGGGGGGGSAANANSASTASTTDLMTINQHRALIFCQLKAMLNIIENDLFKKNMPDVTYLRLDGSVAPQLRHSIVTRFNSDPSIDVLLLTTQVGGLGLNLTGADTVIFVEHDWNPMKDLQAMDRAHRIGQRKVVNVYRLITRATLEEKIMGLQKFKVQTVNTIISSENSKIETMATDQLLDLFTHGPPTGSASNKDLNSTTLNSNNTGMKAILDSLPDLWDQKQYDDEYDLTQFISKLN